MITETKLACSSVQRARCLFLSLISFIFYLYVYGCCACMKVSAPHMCSPCVGQKRASHPSGCYWNYRWSWVIMWVLEIKAGSSVRTASALNCWVTSPAPSKSLTKPEFTTVVRLAGPQDLPVFLCFHDWGHRGEPLHSALNGCWVPNAGPLLPSQGLTPWDVAPDLVCLYLPILYLQPYKGTLCAVKNV